MYEAEKIKAKFRENLAARIEGIMLEGALAQHDITTVGGSVYDVRDIERIIADVLFEKANYLSTEES